MSSGGGTSLLASPPGLGWLRRSFGIADTVLVAALAIGIGLAVYGAATTQGFLTVSNVKAILTATAFVGIVAVGMTVIMLSGSLFSLALGQTVAVTAMFFLYGLQFGLAVAIVLTLLLGFATGAVQGVIIGAWGANPIIVTIGAAGLIEGFAVWISSGHSILPPEGSTAYERLARPLFGVPFAIYVFFAVAIVMEIVLRKMRFGRELYLMGENRNAARAAALPVTLLTTGAFGLAGLCTAIAGVLIGATSQNASLLLEGSYTYDAIAATLVGGNAITGGRGSIWRTAAGAVLIATISDMLLLRSYSTGVQILVKGRIVVFVVIVTNFRQRRA
jgi:ribose/xylose/arabinose/galactoside ABC-type transport system permease subunit